jgi:hypothetical protein
MLVAAIGKTHSIHCLSLYIDRQVIYVKAKGETGILSDAFHTCHLNTLGTSIKPFIIRKQMSSAV